MSVCRYLDYYYKNVCVHVNGGACVY